MKSTNPKTLRAQMKSYLDLAAREPLRILRRSGQSYILIDERRFGEMREELVSLQRQLIALSQSESRRIKEQNPSTPRIPRKYQSKDAP